jgi:hypothetical protein
METYSDAQFSEEVQKLLAGPKKPKSADIYKRYQVMFSDWLIEKGLVLETTVVENSFCEFMLFCNTKYKPGTLWTIYSCVNSLYKSKKGKDLNDLVNLRTVMKRLTCDYLQPKRKFSLLRKFPPR